MTDSTEAAPSAEERDYNGPMEMWREFKRRLKGPPKQAVFWVFGMTPLLSIGFLAIWIEVWRFQNGHSDTLDSVILALATVFPAIAIAPAFELLLHRDNIVKCLGGIALAVSSLLALYLLAFGHPSAQCAVTVGIFGCLFSIVTWWIASSDNERLQDQPGADDAAGGPPGRPLSTRKTNIRT